ncbi:FtsX-like permease family protein [Hymenobacter psychrophilus]|uniref:ABC-type antimicrobial peptide transport system, permease component n=1 Tax=Hymenobacter psychrophilus TaxID=651662 RepID=A0A1H3L1D4_9BACT|nr:FtsX-like permease family protein [Hymenobacter psychrophilus]SDY58213.1 ABC-type antimicrobial peptide transport system, permease component [Hymenobacter psychrophilus]
MLPYPLLLIYRNFKRFKSTFFINLIGLSTGLACALLIYLWISDERSFDRYHTLDGRLYQVLENRRTAAGIETQTGTVPLLAEALRREMPEIELVATTTPVPFFPKFTLAAGGLHLSAVAKYADPAFFQLFSYPLLVGTPATVLRDKHAIVLSAALATKLFNSPQNSLGKAVQWQMGTDSTQTSLVAGVFARVPRNSSEQFDFVLPFASFKDRMQMSETIKWDDDGPFTTYLALKEGADPAQFQAKLAGLLKTKSTQAQGRTLFVRPFAAGYLHGTYENGVVTGGRIAYVRLLTLIAGLILVIASINFMNLFTAKASRRVKEVGIRKALGASRAALIVQYLTESVVMALLALVVAVGLVQLVLPQFSALTGKPLALRWEWPLVAAGLALALGTGLLAGSYPAFYLSGFQPAAVLKGKLPTRAADVWTRQGLVVLQFTLSVLFIVAVVVVNAQLAFVQRQPLGYDKAHVLRFDTGGKAARQQAAFLSEVKKLPGVVQASSVLGGFLGGRYVAEMSWRGKRLAVGTMLVNYDLVETMGLHLVAGRSFAPQYRADSAAILVNQALVAGLGMLDPVGQRLDGARIVGVVRDFHYESLHEKIKPLLLQLDPQINTVLVKLQPHAEQATLARLQQLYAAYNPGFTLDYTFLDADYQAQYVAERRVAVLARYFAGLAILISALGLLGLAAFTAERRRKEIGIRKALGASELSIVWLLTSSLTWLVVVAIGLALPLSYLLMERWLAGFAYRVEWQWWYFAAAGLGALLIAWLTVSVQAWRAARRNPVLSLRAE